MRRGHGMKTVNTAKAAEAQGTKKWRGGNRKGMRQGKGHESPESASHRRGAVVNTKGLTRRGPTVTAEGLQKLVRSGQTIAERKSRQEQDLAFDHNAEKRWGARRVDKNKGMDTLEKRAGQVTQAPEAKKCEMEGRSKKKKESKNTLGWIRSTVTRK